MSVCRSFCVCNGCASVTEGEAKREGEEKERGKELKEWSESTPKPAGAAGSHREVPLLFSLILNKGCWADKWK